MTGGRRVLLFSPVFHGYWQSIARGFEANGHQVSVHCIDEHPSPLAKVRNKVVYEGLDRIRAGAGTARFERAVTETARAVLRRERPEAVVVVKGDLLTDAFWDDLVSSGVPHVLWLYDEVRRMRHSADRLRQLHSVASYSPNDVVTLTESGVRAQFVANAFDPVFAHQRIPSESVVFIGARYPVRTAVLTELWARGVPVRAYGRDWSHRVFDRLRSWEWNRPDLPSSPTVPRATGMALLGGALAALNIHGDQDGFTMRTFEAAGVGGLQMIDRSDVGDFYEPDREILTFASVDELVELVQRARREPLWASRIRSAAKKRTLAEHTFADRTRALASMWD